MANTVQHRRGNTVSINSHKGPAGEFVYNTDTNRIHSMDGVAFGGHAHALLSDLDGRALTSTTVSAGTGLTGGGSLAANRTIALNSTSIASLAKADTAVQPGSLSAVATSGAYSDLSGRPVAGQFIPSGGAAGQVLAKSSATNFDTAWVTSAAATAVSYAPQTLTSEQQGQAVANIGGSSLAGYRNKNINGNFDVRQRGNGPFNVPAGASVYTADRWLASSGTGASNTITLTSSSGRDGAFVLGWVRNTAGSTESVVSQRIEDVRTLKPGKATVTFWKWGPALTVRARQVFGTGGSAAVDIAVGSVPTLETWTKYTFSFDVPSISGKTIGDNSYIELQFVRTVAGNNGTIQISRISLVEGDATAENDPFSPRHIQQEFALCQRYLQLHEYGTTNGSISAAGQLLAIKQSFFTPMRAAPSRQVLTSSGESFPAGESTAFDITTHGFGAFKSSTGPNNNANWYESALFDAEI